MESTHNSRADRKKRSGWFKIVDLILRSCHIGISSILFGGLVWEIPFARLANWHNLVIATGSALIIFNIFKCRHWPYQGRGLMTGLHLGLIWFVHVRPDLLLPVLMTALAVGVTGSHMPAFLRHWSLVHRRVLD
ncbi:MAG: hypothetical protein PHF56_08915 [Desulfuromonadaceae bacterium]|nr:hypothetical protein [Desulfuromonadaceae bacterium]